VPVLVSKGMPSLTQLHGTALEIKRAGRAGKRTYIYQFGDHDPSGVLIPQTIKRRLGELSSMWIPIVKRVALTEGQIRRYRLPSRPTKREGNRHANGFEGDSTELDALPSRVLRQMVRDCIERHIRPEQLEALRTAEESEREILTAFAAKIGGAA
jgi:hypothetical protein